MSDSNGNPSVAHSNKLLRVLVGKPRKYTVQVHKPDGTIIEFQSDHYPSVSYCDPMRMLVLNRSYGEFITAWDPTYILLVEDNPK
jgi:hypothetical protein